MALNFSDLKRKRLDDGNEGKEPLRKKHDEENDFINPFRKAKAKAHDSETDTDSVDEEGSDLEELTEGEAGHTAEDKLEGRDADEEAGLEDDEPLPAFLEKEELPDRKRRRRHMEHEKAESPEKERAEHEDGEEADDEEPRKKKGYSLAFRRML